MRSPAQLASDKAEAAPSKQQARSEGTRQEVARRGAEIEARTAGGAAVARPRPPVTPVGARSMALPAAAPWSPELPEHEGAERERHRQLKARRRGSTSAATHSSPQRQETPSRVGTAAGATHAAHAAAA